MTKKEQAAFDALVDELRLARAWRTTEKIEPDVAPPDGNGPEYTYGWLPYGYVSVHYRVDIAASAKSSHYTGPSEVAEVKKREATGQWIYVSGNQQPRHLHSKRSAALKFARYQIEQAIMRELAKLDREIESAEKEEQA